MGMRAWKRAPLQKIFGRTGPALRFADTPEAALRPGRPVMVWAGSETEALRAACARADRPLVRVEDGFLRSRGLGAELIPPLSLVTDDLGIYYDPTRPSRLEALIAEAAALPPDRLRRAERLVAALVATGVSKYNLTGAGDLPDPGGRALVLVPGQVEDDASIRLGAGDLRTNLALLKAARARHPDAFLVYKPHPDVEAGLRAGRVDPGALAGLADHVAHRADPMALLARADRVVTMTSLMGFEALLRGVPVSVTGAPFYAGWGLTEDLGLVPARRRARPSLMALAHAALIAYPRYHDPVTGRPCPVEVAVERLASGQIPAPALRLRALAKLQGWCAGQAWLWRR
jgi:capsular polysaccharide export protein